MIRQSGVGLAATLAALLPAQADVTISGAATANMSCAGGVCVPTAVDAVLNVNELESLLAAGNVEVTTTGYGVQAKDIHVAAALGWSNTSTLALDAYKTVAVERPVTVRGEGGLSVKTNDGGTGGEFWCGSKGRVTFKNFAGTLAINGTAYTLVSSIATLAAAISANPSGAFALANSYDASGDGTYAASPVSTVFSGKFDGLGNTISNLTINDPTDNDLVGLFAETSGTLANIRLTNENVTGASGGSSDDTEHVGGLVAYESSGTIEHAFVSGAVAGNTGAIVGGLTGVEEGAVTSSITTATVSAVAPGAAGGLVGVTGNDSGPITDSYATGNVSGGAFTGGLVGLSSGPIKHSNASGAISGEDQYAYAGGLFGMNNGENIDRSFATGAVTCTFHCGGLVGLNALGPGGTATISKSYSTGSVTGTGGAGAGGLVGFNVAALVIDSYAMGAVSAQEAGGLVGNDAPNSISISRSYSAGTVSGTSGSTGGLIGDDQRSGTLKHDYWDTTTSGITNKSQGAGNIANDPGIKGLSNTKLQSGLPNGFSPRIWAENPNVNGGLPYLLTNAPII
jgi:hypothetical protein